MHTKPKILAHPGVLITTKPNFQIQLSDAEHGDVARLAVKSGLMMDDAVKSIFQVGLSASLVNAGGVL